MGPTNFYRLNEYRISEFADGRLWWDTQFGFGIQVGGPCYIYGDILLLAAQSNEEIGFLKMEYLDHLKRFPLWKKTRYICSASALLDTASGRYLSDQRLRQPVFSPCAARPIISGKFESFRLGQYQISINPDGDISWASHSGMNRIVGGRVLIESDILFIDSRPVEEIQQRKKEFLRTVNTRPKWDRTTFWCRNLVLRSVLQERTRLPNKPACENDTTSRKLIPPGKYPQSDYAEQVWAQMANRTAEWIKVVKSRYAGRAWFKRKKHRLGKNKLD